MLVSQIHKERLLKTWEDYAGENLELVDFETASCPKTVIGSELACLRLFKRFFGADCKVYQSPAYPDKFVFTVYPKVAA